MGERLSAVQLLEAISASIEAWFKAEQAEYRETIEIDNSKEFDTKIDS